MTGLIYKYTNKLNNKCYIGQTVDIKQRRKAHENCIAKDKFHKALRYYGIINFEFSIVESDIPEEKLDEREKYWIKYFDSFPNGYNSGPGGEQLRMKLPLRSKKELGLHSGGNVLFGYTTNDKHEYIIDKKEAKIIRNIFEEYSTGKISIREISKKYKINEQSLYLILKRDCYYDGSKPKIISKKIFDKAQSMRTHFKQQKRKNQHILKGILYDNDGKLFTTNTANKCFLSKNTNHTVRFKICDLLLSQINYEYDKIVVNRESRYIIKFNVYNKRKYIETISIDTYNKRVL